MDPKEKVSLVTGGARIGQVVAEELARRGSHLVLAYRGSRESAEATARRAEALGVRALTLRADLRAPADAEALVAGIESAFGRLDILVNMAARYVQAPLEGLDMEAWHADIETNLRSAYLLSLRAARLLRADGGGRIINFSDWTTASDRPRYRSYLPYYVSKAGVEGLTQALALEMAPEVLVNTIAPGPILAPPDLSEAENTEVLRGTPLRRWGGATEIAKAVLFFVETDFVTGECLRVDGGRHLY